TCVSVYGCGLTLLEVELRVGSGEFPVLEYTPCSDFSLHALKLPACSYKQSGSVGKAGTTTREGFPGFAAHKRHKLTDEMGQLRRFQTSQVEAKRWMTRVRTPLKSVISFDRMEKTMSLPRESGFGMGRANRHCAV